MDVESDSSGLIEAEGRDLRPRHLVRRLAVGTGLVLAVTLLAVALVGRRPAASANVDVVKDTSHSVQAFAKKFQQCGGDDFLGNTCCEKGCACIIKTQFYSMCTTPSKVGHCSVTAAQHEVKYAKMRARSATENIGVKQKKAAEAKKKVGPTREAYEKAYKPVPELRRKGKKAKKAHLAAKKHYKKAKAEAEEAAKTAAARAKDYKWTKENLDTFDKAEAMNRGGQCATINGQCGGQIAPEKACCVIGCICHWKNDYYGQCLPPEGKPNCDQAGYQAQANELRTNATRLKPVVEATAKRKEETAKALEEAEERYKELREAAIKAGRARSIAEEIMRKKKHEADAAKKKYDDLRGDADHAVHNVKYTAAMVKVWAKVAGGDSCSDLSASDISSADAVDYEAIDEPHVKSADTEEAEKEESEEDKELEHLDDGLDLDFDDDDLGLN